MIYARVLVSALMGDPLGIRKSTLEEVAAAAGVSVRYANALLAQEGTSIARLVQSRRLDRCHKALKDPLQAHRTVAEIASSWGFSDMTHFGRRFKAAYGVLPSELRRLSKQN